MNWYAYRMKTTDGAHLTTGQNYYTMIAALDAAIRNSFKLDREIASIHVEEEDQDDYYGLYGY
jgi:hypothetical protein